MTIYHTFLDDSTVSGLETIQGIQNDGSEFGVGISNDISAGIVTATTFYGDGSNLTGISAGITSVTDFTTQNLTVSGIATIGIGTTNLETILNVNGNMIVSGITTIGIGSTSSPSNSQMSFELTNNTILTIRVKGTDGITRVGTVTLA